MPTDTATRSGGLLRERMIIRRTAEMLVSALPPDVLFARVCDLLASQFGAHFVAIVEIEGQRPKTRWSFAAGEDSGIAAIAEVAADRIDFATPSLHPTSHDRVVLFVPLRYGRDCFGFLALGGGIRRFAAESVALLETCARYMAVAIYNVTLSQEKERLLALATHDGLTGVHNRRAFDERLAAEWGRGGRSREPLSLIMVDVDYFKVYNDAYGHVAGDHCLQQIAQALRGTTARAADMVARYGGEEFVGLLPGTPENGAIEIAEKMCQKVTEMRIVHRGSELDRVSISAGVATLVPSFNERPEILIEAADVSLYRAKESGRNRVASTTYLGIAPAARRRFEGRNNLPMQPTSFVGRESEQATVAQALPTCPVVSLLGPGGVGKTRLSISAAHAAISTFPGGAWLIELGAERDGSQLPTVVATALGLSRGASMEHLVTALNESPALLILDSCEHLLAAASALVTEIVKKCPDVRIITTSRQPLELPGELRLRLDPLPLTDATQLFIARAQDVRPQLGFSPADAALVRTICNRVDCLPLAVELAAMRLQHMSLQQLVEHGTALPHHTDLHERMALSFDLLHEHERRFLARLSILDGPFDEEAARATAGGETFDALESFDLLTRLVEKSLIQVDLESGSYRLLSTIAEYVRPRLVEFDSPDAIRAVAARHYAELVAGFHEELRNGAQSEIFTRYEAVRENVAAALDWTLGGEDVEAGAILAADMAPYWIEIGHFAEAGRHLDRAIQQAERLSRRRILDVLEAAVEIAFQAADVQNVDELADRLRTETGATNDTAETGRVVLALALARIARGRASEAKPLYQHAVNAFRSVTEPRSLARALTGLAEIVAEVDGDLPRAIGLLDEALDAARRAGSPSLVLEVLGRLVDFVARSGQTTHAIDMLRDAAAQCHEVGDETSGAWITFLLARQELESDPIVGRMHVRDALERLRVHAHPARLAACFELLADVASERGDDDTAVRLLAFAATLRRAHGVAGSPRERRSITLLADRLETRMDRSAFDRAHRGGGTMPLDSAVHRALSEEALVAGEAMVPV